MSDLIPTTALGHLTPKTAEFGSVSLRENSGLGLASLALRKGTAMPAPFGLSLPDAGGWVANGAVSAFWTGPQQWMVGFDDAATQDVATTLSQACPGCSVTEQTDGWVAFEISTPQMAAFLERLVNVNLSEFGPGGATRTTIEHMGVYVIRRSQTDLAILGMRSSARSLWHALTTVAQRLTKENAT